VRCDLLSPLSYLRYLLPCTSRIAPAGTFRTLLSLSRRSYSDLEATVERIRAVDPGLTRVRFLDWLAQWLDLAVEEDWDPK